MIKVGDTWIEVCSSERVHDPQSWSGILKTVHVLSLLSWMYFYGSCFTQEFFTVREKKGHFLPGRRLRLSSKIVYPDEKPIYVRGKRPFCNGRSRQSPRQKYGPGLNVSSIRDGVSRGGVTCSSDRRREETGYCHFPVPVSNEPSFSEWMRTKKNGYEGTFLGLTPPGGHEGARGPLRKPESE